MNHVARAGRWLPCVALTCLLAGCGTGLDADYGWSRSTSINGTSVLADLLRDRGHEVRVAVRLTDELSEWAEVIVRFAPRPGPPEKDEAAWYDQWLAESYDVRLIYIPADYNALKEYWTTALEQLPASATERERERIAEAMDAPNEEPWRTSATSTPAPADRWFAVRSEKPSSVCKKLEGPWAEGVVAQDAALTRHETIKVEDENVLLRGDDEPLVVSWSPDEGSHVLVIASGTFLLNLPITRPARWPLVARTIDWIEATDYAVEAVPGRAANTRPKRIAFVEGSNLDSEPRTMPSVFSLLKIDPFGFIAAHVVVLGLAGCLAWAPRLGRPRAAAPSEAERPVAHPEALGALLERTRRAEEARSLLEAYRRWRHSPSGRGGGAARGKEL